MKHLIVKAQTLKYLLKNPHNLCHIVAYVRIIFKHKNNSKNVIKTTHKQVTKKAKVRSRLSYRPS